MKDKLMEGLLRFAAVLQGNKYMSAIKNGFIALLPITICGAFCTLILNVVCSTTTKGISLAKVDGFAWLEQLSPMFKAANYATLNFMAIGLVIVIAVELGKSYGKKDMSVPIIALSSFVSLCTTFVTGTTVDGAAYVAQNVLPVNFTNAQGLFLGMIAAIVSVEIYVKLINSGKMEIKMPESVPSNVSKTFSTLIPAIITIMIMAGFGMAFELIMGYTFYDAIAMWIQAPLKGVLTGLPGYLFLFFCTTVLWTLGIHGTQVLGPIYTATLLEALTTNLEVVTAGGEATFILNRAFVSCHTIVTGAGITGGLLIAILLFSKREDYKTIAKLSIAPGIFNINETLTFGLPIVLNPILAIPFMISPIISASFAYFMTSIGFASVYAYDVPWTTPPLLSAYLASGGNINNAIVQGVGILLAFLIYIPFVLIANKQAQQTINEN